MLASLRDLMRHQKDLIHENMELRYQKSILEAQLQRFLVIDKENVELKKLLLTAAQHSTRAMVAHILAVNTHKQHWVILNKGKRDGIFVGQPVLDAKGIVGQIIRVGALTSTVLLISDRKSGVPVRNTRTGERAILHGMDDVHVLRLSNIPKTSSVHQGDVLVTSGLGQLYPEGYPVGEVKSVQDLSDAAYLHVDVKPVVTLENSHLVLILWPDADQIAWVRDIHKELDMIERSS